MKTQSKTLAIAIAGAALLLLAGFASRTPATPLPLTVAAQPATAPAPVAVVATVLPKLLGAPTPFADAAALPASQSLTIRAALSHPAVLAGRGREVYYEATLAASPSAATSQRRSPVQLALVIDRSGSMAGPKLEQTKQAARGVLSQLVAGDRLVIVTYDDAPQVVLDSANVSPQMIESAQQRIDAIRPGGSTNLEGGIQQAADRMLADRQADRSVRRMVLLSDGQANVGEVRPAELAAQAEQLRQKGITLSTIGVGLDFNPQVMEGMAGRGGGRFRFMEEPEEIARGFSKELELAARLVASDVRVVLHPGDGVTVEEVYGFDFAHSGSDVVVRLPDMASTTQFVVRARLSVDASAPSFEVMSAAATFAEIATDRARVSVAGPSLAARTAAADEVDRSLDRTVLAEGINARGIADARRAMDLYNAGKHEEAMRALDTATGSVQLANRDLHYQKLDESAGVFTNLRSLFAASANALGGTEGSEQGRRATRKAIRNFGTNAVVSE